jgi:GntR family transcriptional regulator, rspAB operon transcriptional repressor
MLQSPADPPQGQTPGVARLRPVEEFSGSLARKTYQTLREAIISLAYRPGEALKKPEICAHLGVSRSPVSEAIARLAAEGLFEVVPQAGTFVARFSMEDIREGAFRREAIELAAVEEIAPRITEAQLTELRRNLRVQEALVEDGDYAGFYKMDAEMHALILSFTGHRKLVQIADTAWVHVNRARQLVLPMKGRVEETLAEHRAIIEALEAHDPEAARQVMRRHLRQLLSHLEPLEREHPELFAPERKG